jgi:hypothetical protein
MNTCSTCLYYHQPKCHRFPRPIDKVPPEHFCGEYKKIGKTPRATFTKPTLDEVKEYADSIGYKLDCEEFMDFYESKNWMIGKNKVKDWQACVRTWRKRDQKASKIRLMPIKNKGCYKQGCNMPAVYKSAGAYDSYYCQEHMPEKVKELYK